MSWIVSADWQDEVTSSHDGVVVRTHRMRLSSVWVMYVRESLLEDGTLLDVVILRVVKEPLR